MSQNNQNDNGKNKNNHVYLIDFLNIAHLSNENGAPKLSNFELIRDKILIIDLSAKIIGIADPSAPYVIDQREKYESLVKKSDIIQVGPGEKADYYIIKYA